MAKKKKVTKKLTVGQIVQFLKDVAGVLTPFPAIVHRQVDDSTADLHVFTETEVEFWKDVEYGEAAECFCHSFEGEEVIKKSVESVEEE